MITVNDLKPLNLKKGEFLYCRVCGTKYSATKGDYFLFPTDYVFTCCDTPMVLAKENIMIEVIKE